MTNIGLDTIQQCALIGTRLKKKVFVCRATVWLALGWPWQRDHGLGRKWQRSLFHLWTRDSVQVPNQTWPGPHLQSSPGTLPWLMCVSSRSHVHWLQVVEDGYEFFAKRQLVTLFSAPNYCGEFDNAGAMMSVDETLMCSFQVCDEMFSPIKLNFGVIGCRYSSLHRRNGKSTHLVLGVRLDAPTLLQRLETGRGKRNSYFAYQHISHSIMDCIYTSVSAPTHIHFSVCTYLGCALFYFAVETSLGSSQHTVF